MSDVTHWAYTFQWKGVPCEAKDGSIFVNGRRVEEFPNVNESAQTEEKFFIEGKDVTEVILGYINAKAETAKSSLTLKTIGDLTLKALEKIVLAPSSKEKTVEKPILAPSSKEKPEEKPGKADSPRSARQ